MKMMSGFELLIVFVSKTMENKNNANQFLKRQGDAYPSIFSTKRTMRSDNVRLEITWNGQVGIWRDAILLKVGWY